MPTGFVGRTKGKEAVGNIYMGGVSHHAGANFGLEIPLTVTAVANTDFTASVPAGATLLSAQVYTTTAFTGTTVTVQVGSTAGGVDYVAAVSIKPVGLVLLTLLTAAAANLYALPNPPNLFVRVAQTGATAVGVAALFLNFTA